MNNNSILITYLLFLMVGSLTPILVNASVDLELETTRRSDMLIEHKARIKSDNSEEAIAATEIGLNSGDSEIRSMTLEAALGSSNQRVKTTALRWLFQSRTSLPLLVDKPIASDKGNEYAYRLWKGVVLNQLNINKETDEIRVSQTKHLPFSGGHLMRGGFQLEFASTNAQCTILAEVDTQVIKDGLLQLKGNIDCMFNPHESLPNKGDEDGSVTFTINLS